MLPSFITDEKKVNWWGLDQLSQYYCAYSPQFFRQELFEQNRLAFPLGMSNAIGKRKSEFLAGRYCAKKALARFGLKDFCIKTGPDRSPVWPNGLHGSISHTKNMATAVVSDDQYLLGLGIDIEHVICDGPMNETKSYVLTHGEHCLFEPMLLSDNELFTVIFSLKESFFKAAYPLVKHYFGFEAVSVIDVDQSNGKALFRLNETLHDRLRKGAVFSGRFYFIEQDLLATLVLLDR